MRTSWICSELSQGRQKTKFAPGRLTFQATAPAAGFVTGIDNVRLARIARFAGAPLAKGAGVDLFHKLGDKVKKGAPLYRVHAEFAADFQFARALAMRGSGYTIGQAAALSRAMVEP